MHLLAINIAISLMLSAAHGALRCSKEKYNCPITAPCCGKDGRCGASKEQCSKDVCVAGCELVSARPKAWTGYGPYWKRPSPYSKSSDDRILDFDAIRELEHMGIYSHCKNSRHAALTFDDGIDPTRTPQLLRILKKKNVPATFCILGQSISKWLDLGHSNPNPNYHANRQILKKMVKEGHTVASHTFDHQGLTGLDSNQVEQEMKETDNLFLQVLGVRPKLMRPPEGLLSYRVISQLRKRGNVVLFWSHDTGDWWCRWENPGHVLEYVQQEVPRSRKSSNGPILLQHDIFSVTVDYQEAIIDDFLSKGYQLVTMHECLGIKPYRQ